MAADNVIRFRRKPRARTERRGAESDPHFAELKVLWRELTDFERSALLRFVEFMVYTRGRN